MKGLREHLQKAEIEFIARHGGGRPINFKWDENIEEHARRIGFRIKSHDDGVDGNKWIVTTGDINICLTDGFIYRGIRYN